jgi:SAM-dependent MidA family methyltransferase
MGLPPSCSPVSAAFAEAFHAEAGPGAGLSFDRFMALALYHPELGYYRRSRHRVGYAAGTDFYTASTSGPVFGELAVAATVKLLAGRDPADFTWVEIGAESDGGILAGVNHPFAAARTLRVGEPMNLGGNGVVFSNELFDAQPFRRLVRRGGAWHEAGVRCDQGRLAEADLGPVADPGRWPADAPEGYRIDAPVAAAHLAADVAAQPWRGLFVAFDYGKPWAELAGECPEGTARAYHQHAQSNDLLARPGEQDLTCHVCWDWIATALETGGFAPARLEAQEAFFVHHAASYLEAALRADARQLTERKRSLMQLLHPAHLGRKFQVLHAWRENIQVSP